MTSGAAEQKRIFMEASIDAKLGYLYEAIIERRTSDPHDTCKSVFVSRRQAKFFAAVVLVAAVAFGVGAGYITVSEAISLAKP